MSLAYNGMVTRRHSAIIWLICFDSSQIIESERCQHRWYCISHVQKATPAAATSGALFPLIPNWYSPPVYYGTMKSAWLLQLERLFIEELEIEVCQVVEQWNADKRTAHGSSVLSWVTATVPFLLQVCLCPAFLPSFGNDSESQQIPDPTFQPLGQEMSKRQGYA